MNKKGIFPAIGLILFAIGLLIVVVTHFMLLGGTLPDEFVDFHASLNLLGAALIVVGRFIP